MREGKPLWRGEAVLPEKAQEALFVFVGEERRGDGSHTAANATSHRLVRHIHSVDCSPHTSARLVRGKSRGKNEK
jgi:hypothetical protein